MAPINLHCSGKICLILNSSRAHHCNVSHLVMHDKTIRPIHLKICNLVDFLLEVINLRWNWCSLVGWQLSDQQNATPRCNQLLMAGPSGFHQDLWAFFRPHTENVKLEQVAQELQKNLIMEWKSFKHMELNRQCRVVGTLQMDLFLNPG